MQRVATAVGTDVHTNKGDIRWNVKKKQRRR